MVYVFRNIFIMMMTSTYCLNFLFLLSGIFFLTCHPIIVINELLLLFLVQRMCIHVHLCVNIATPLINVWYSLSFTNEILLETSETIINDNDLKIISLKEMDRLFSFKTCNIYFCIFSFRLLIMMFNSIKNYNLYSHQPEMLFSKYNIKIKI